jgi:hypothetical protein
MIKLTVHAAEMLIERQISMEWVISAIERPDRCLADPRRPELTRSYRAIAAADGRVLRVVHRPDFGDILVVTAHFDRGAKL